MHFYDSVDISLVQVRECDVVAVEERKSAVVVLEVNSLAHSLRILVDEAEYASVLTAVLFVHQRSAEFKSYVVVFFFFYLFFNYVGSSVQLQNYRRVSQSESVVEDVVYLV